MDLGHYIDRRFAATKFNILNLEVQCIKCNRWKDGNIYMFTRMLQRKHGRADITSYLNAWAKSRPDIFISYDDVEWLIKYYQKLIKIKNGKHTAN